MPGRKYPLITNEYFHIFNRGIDHRPTFTDLINFRRAKETIQFYRFASLPIKLSQFLVLGNNRRQEIFNQIDKSNTLVDIICYCLMPNHFHFLLQQKQENGISKFLSNFQNSYTRYFNTKRRRIGPLFLDQFKAVRVETNEQLLHLSRYIHLNPYTSYVVKNITQLENYQWSSLADYLEGKNELCAKKIILDFFKKPEDYKKFIFDQANYQRDLKSIEHLTFDHSP